MCCQTGNRYRLPASKTINLSPLLNRDATEMEPCNIRDTIQLFVPLIGARRQGNTFSFQSREKNVLDFSSPKTLSSVNLRDLESKLGGSFSE